MRRLPALVVASIVLAGTLTAAPSRSRGSRGRRRPPAASGQARPPTDRARRERQRHRRHAHLDADDQHGRHLGYAVRRSTTSGSGYTTIATVTLALGHHDHGQSRHRDVLLRAAVAIPELGQRRLERGERGRGQRGRRGTRTAPRTRPTPAATTTATRPTRATPVPSTTPARATSTRARRPHWSCTDPGQDRHRYWGYAFGLPGSISAVQGIQVQPTIEVNNNGGSSLICVQLSWDGGASWTATKQVNVTNSLTTYTLGSATDTGATRGRSPS